MSEERSIPDSAIEAAEDYLFGRDESGKMKKWLSYTGTTATTVQIIRAAAPAIRADTLEQARERVRGVKRTQEEAIKDFTTPLEWERENAVVDRCLAAIDEGEV
jgi:hypothetical protein